MFLNKIRNRFEIKLISLLILFFIIFSYSNVFADDEDEEELNENQIQEAIIESSTNAVEEPIINSRAAIIYDRTTKKILWGKEENVKRAMASTTKIMTAIIVLEKGNLTDIVEISKRAANTGGSRLKINTADKITVNDLLYGLMLRSGNDTAVALAEHIGGSVENFAQLMNEKARELDLKNTHFVTPHGLDDDEHYTTAYELALITDYALNNKKFCNIVNSKTATISVNGNQRNLYNTNELLGNTFGVDGVKTGFTGNAGRCLVTSITRNNNQVITIVLGADTKKKRTLDTLQLIKYTFEKFERVNVENIINESFQNWKEVNCNRIYINKSNNNKIEIELNEIKDKIIPIKIGEQKDLKVEINCIYNYEAPLNKNSKIGNLLLKNKDEIIESIDIINKEEILKRTTFDYMCYFFNIISNGSIFSY